MDAVKFLMERNRMLTSGFATPIIGGKLECEEQAEQIVRTVEGWSEEHPRKTRQREFLRLFPQVRLTDDGIIDLCPAQLSENHRVPGTRSLCGSMDKNCSSCIREFWGQEVE